MPAEVVIITEAGFYSWFSNPLSINSIQYYIRDYDTSHLEGLFLKKKWADPEIEECPVALKLRQTCDPNCLPNCAPSCTPVCYPACRPIKPPPCNPAFNY